MTLPVNDAFSSFILIKKLTAQGLQLNSEFPPSTFLTSHKLKPFLSQQQFKKITQAS